MHEIVECVRAMQYHYQFIVKNALYLYNANPLASALTPCNTMGLELLYYGIKTEDYYK